MLNLWSVHFVDTNDTFQCKFKILLKHKSYNPVEVLVSNVNYLTEFFLFTLQFYLPFISASNYFILVH